MNTTMTTDTTTTTGGYLEERTPRGTLLVCLDCGKRRTIAPGGNVQAERQTHRCLSG